MISFRQRDIHHRCAKHRFTVHTGCPVLEGTKLITAQWMRAGVSEREPWRLYRSEGTTLQ